MKHLYTQIIELLDVSIYKLETTAKIGNGAIQRGIDNNSVPTVDTLLKIKRHFPFSMPLIEPVLNAIMEGTYEHPQIPGTQTAGITPIETLKPAAKDLHHLLLSSPKKPGSKVVNGVTESDVNYEGQGTPVVEKSFSMGLASNSFVTPGEVPIAYLNIPEARGCDAFTTAAHGDSMMSYIYPGDWIGFKRIYDFNEFIQYGEPYGIVTEEFELIKYVRKGHDKKHFLLVSENEDYEDQEVPLKLITGLYHVRAVLPFSPLRTLARRRFAEHA